MRQAWKSRTRPVAWPPRGFAEVARANPADRQRRLLECLHNLRMFYGMGPDQLQRIAAGSTEIDAPRGSTIFSRGECCTGLHLVVFGLVKLSLTGRDGDERVVDLVGMGRSLGPCPLAGDAPRRLTAEALQDTRLVHVSRTTVLAELERGPEFARELIGDLTRRVDQLERDLENCMLRSGKERVAGYLLSQLPVEHSKADGAVTLPATKGILASRMNLTHEHFSRILRDFSLAGLIVMNGRKIEIPDIARLQSFGSP